jgi:hypothetical protein
MVVARNHDAYLHCFSLRRRDVNAIEHYFSVAKHSTLALYNDWRRIGVIAAK